MTPCALWWQWMLDARSAALGSLGIIEMRESTVDWMHRAGESVGHFGEVLGGAREARHQRVASTVIW
jgi:hypothetical protein